MKGIKFDDTHSYYDLNLILSDCSISPATPKENYINIPGADGSLDLTEALGMVNFNDRTGKIIFSVFPSDDFEEKKSEIANFLNGQKFKITLDKDPDWYYIGRCSINDHKCDKKIGQITVDLKLQPWKLKQKETIISVVAIPGIPGIPGMMTKFVTLSNSRKPVIPTVKVTGDAVIDYKDYTGNFVEGTYKIPELCLYEGKTEQITVSTNGTVTFTYQEGSL